MKTITRFSLISLFCALSANAAGEETADLERIVAERERAFAATMADRSFEDFKSFLAEETVFFAGENPLRGKAEVAAAWKGFFDGPDAPFSWAPETVAVLESGTLALSSGPVLNSSGDRFSTFQSVWRLESDGQWRIIFDKGHRWCEPPKPAEPQ